MYTMYNFLCLLITSIVCITAENCPPKIYIQPKNVRTIFFKPGEEVSLPCVADGSPAPTYTWQKNSLTLKISGTDDRIIQVQDNGTIVFKKPISSDEAIYQCFASNAYGVSASMKIAFREAKLGRFRPEERKTHTVQAGDSLTLYCDWPVSYPKPEITWGIKQVDGRFQEVELDNRVTMDLEGRLIFANVMKSDEQGGRPYFCMVINAFLRSISSGPEHVVQVVGDSKQYMPPRIVWTSPSDMIVLKGESLTLGCVFSGSPTPEVSWEKTNGDKMLPANRTELRKYGQELYISDLQLSDMGKYKCLGVNGGPMDGQARLFQVRIESRPYWVDQPKDFIANEGEHATFVCRADGMPSPLIRWYINGVPLKSSLDPRIKSERFNSSNSNIITITNLNVTDRMNIQCNASNKHDYLWADVYLNIRDTVSAASYMYDGFVCTFVIGITCIILSF